MCTVLSLQSAGIPPANLRIEVVDPVLKGGKVDLVVTDVAGRTIVEMKYPRGSRTSVSPDTMTLGELLRDFLRVALVPAADRWVVLVLEPSLRRYLARRDAAWWTESPGGAVVLNRGELESLPKTARDAIGPLQWLLPVQATCVVAEPVDLDLALFAYQVDAPGSEVVGARLMSVERAAPEAGLQISRTRSGKATARSEILAAINSLIARSGLHEVAVQDVVHEMRRRGARYSDSTVRTMMTSHMCAQVHGPNIAAYDDLDRVDRGTYRLRLPH
ncbi:hypothetical protein [Phycicoccus sonneratiae]|uniref:Uncharacterized protein n=1 Tax=Phycicoccus sonneratiae TaxID=2807628 RepID=A0ABS2CIW3_9MICO|nr:hypothetical protein [Phycicoccus sonneraticus]MBM6399788.1 hypothetical protein [Phycicoccus sonneraticus]